LSIIRDLTPSNNFLYAAHQAEEIVKYIIQFLYFFIFSLLSGCAAVEGASNRSSFDYPSTKGVGRIHVSVARDVCWLQIVDEINTETVKAFRLAVDDLKSRKCGSRWVSLNSPGGSVNAAIAIGNIIRKNRLDTSLFADGGRCHSACGIVFIAGTRREVNKNLFAGNIGFHQISTIDYNGSRRCLQRLSPAYIALKKYTDAMLSANAASAFVDMVGSTDCAQIRTYPYDFLLQIGIVTGSGGAGVRLF
jgi:hypothetical protein